MSAKVVPLRQAKNKRNATSRSKGRQGKRNRHGQRDWLIGLLIYHMLRHSTGYALAARGMDTRRLQHFLGHASITNTVRYTAMRPEPFKDIWRS